MDIERILNHVFEKFQRCGIGTMLMERIEAIAAKNADIVCLGVGLHSGYGAAQKMYAKRGYIPDGSGVWSGSAPAEPYGMVENGDDFAFETVFSTYGKVEFLIEAKKRGYKLISNFITTRDANINIDRVAIRASKGGHDVPADKIKSRYYKAMEQLKYLFDISDELYIYDNSEQYKLAYMQKDNKSYGYVNSESEQEEWVKKYILPYKKKIISSYLNKI